MNDKTNNASRREFIKKLAYIPPAVVSLTVLPAFQASGSGWNGNDHPQPSNNTLGGNMERRFHFDRVGRHGNHR